MRPDGPELSPVAEKKRPTVIKIGGSTLGHLDTTLEDLVALQRRGDLPVVVHGGGATISEWMQRQGIMPRFIRGLRVTDAASLQIAVSVLTGLVNKQLVTAINALGGKAVGLSGVDGAMLEARVVDPELGYVGEVVRVNPEPVLELMGAGYIPLVAPVGIDQAGGSNDSSGMLNINGDTAAGHLAWALEADRLIFLTDVEGVLDSSRRLIPRLTAHGARALLASGVASDGMIPKLEACVQALERVSVAHIVDGRTQGALLNAMEGGEGGTRLEREKRQR